MTRLEANRAILKLISEYIESAPDQRFGQALANLGISQDNRNYFRESKDMLDDVEMKAEHLKHVTLHLSARDAQTFQEALSSPPESNEVLSLAGQAKLVMAEKISKKK